MNQSLHVVELLQQRGRFFFISLLDALSSETGLSKLFWHCELGGSLPSLLAHGAKKFIQLCEL